MTKVKLLTGLALGIFMAGCNSEEALEAPGMKTLKVQVEEYTPSTRVGFTDGEAAFFWTAGDKIGTTTDKAKNAFSGMALIAGAETGTATFKGSISGTPEGYAVYPYVESGYHQITAEGELTYQFPASYTYTQLDSEYGKTDGNSFNPPMWAQVIDKKASFKHLGGMFAIQVDKLPQGDMQFIFTTSNKITGTFKTNLMTGEPILTTTESETNNTVTINFSNNDESQSTGFFYIPVPTGEYSSITAVIKDDKGKEIAAGAWSNQIVSRRVIIRGKIGEEEMTGGEASKKIVGDASGVADALKENATDVKVTELKGTSNTISMPANTSMNNEPVSISFQSVENGASFTVKDENIGGTAAASQVTLSIPAVTSENAPEATIEMPNSTVTLAANSEEGATYKEVTAATAENTLIISQGVTVTTLKVKAGNVRLKKGGKIGTVSRHTENSSTVYIILEEGADKPTGSVDNSCKVISAAEYDLVKACAKGGSYSLNSDVTLTSPLVISNTMILNLNGYSIKPSSDTWTKVLNTSDAVVLVRRGGNLTINDNGQGSIDYNKCTNIYTAVKLTDSNDESDAALKNQEAILTVNGGILTGYYYGICGNGGRHETEITVKGGTISGVATDGTGIFHPQEGTLTVSGGTISGVTGIEMRAGTLSISGGTITSTAKAFTEAASGSGNTIFGAAVAVSQHTTHKNLKASINGGTLTGPYALYEKYLQTPEGFDATKISLEVKDGTFNGTIFSQNCPNFVTGGIFSDPSALCYLGKDADVKVKLDEDKSGGGFITTSGQTVEVDLDGNTFTFTDPTVGSAGTETNNCQLNKGSKVTFKNGTMVSQNTKKMIQNYCELLIENMTIEATKVDYVISNNNQSCTINNSTITAGDGKCAFDVYFWPGNTYVDGITVTVKGNSVINGNVEFGGDNTTTEKKGKLIIEESTFNGNLVVNSNYTATASSNISISGGTFNGTGWDTYTPEE